MPSKFSIGCMALAAMVALPVTAQRSTFVVDAAGGAGSQFTTIEPAVRAARDGDVIIVRAGAYAGFPVWKGVSILAEPGVSLLSAAPNVSFVNLPANRDAMIYGFAWNAANATAITIQNCLGRVLVDGCNVATADNSQEICAIAVSSSSQVTISGCVVLGGPAIVAVDSRITINDTLVTGHDVNLSGTARESQPALNPTRSTVMVARSALHGGDGAITPSHPPAPGLAARESTVVIAGDWQTAVEAGGNSVVPFSAIVGLQGTATIDPNVVVASNGGASESSGTMVVTKRRLLALSGQSAPLGGTLRLDLFMPSGEAYALLFGLPGQVINLPGIGDLWFDVGLPFLIAKSGTVDATQHAQLTLGLSSNPNLRGFALTWQAIGTLGSELATSNPFTHLLR